MKVKDNLELTMEERQLAGMVCCLAKSTDQVCAGLSQPHPGLVCALQSCLPDLPLLPPPAMGPITP